ncbi:MAG: cobalamin-dependent protein [Anaerolineales bacterium]|nr:cobalamin-dependent protein [Anaerolineales bacterium]
MYSEEMIARLVDLEEKVVLELVKKRLAAGDDPLTIIEESQDAMRQVGKRYEERKYYLSGLMMAGEIFRQIMELVQPLLVSQLCGNESGQILLGTVQGDIHDIGKNIFGTMLRCHGFTVTDLGVDVPPSDFLEMAERIKPDIIGLSGLLTISYDVMRQIVRLLRKSDEYRPVHTPIFIGGGMINADICAYVGADYWAIDAMVGVEMCKELVGA